MGCLPEISELSLASQFALLQDHLEALRWHLEKLETEMQINALQVLKEQQHFHEIQERVLASQAILKQWSTSPESTLKNLKIVSD